MSGLDRVISSISPQWGLRREIARARMAGLKKSQAYYDGADQGRRGASIRRHGADANSVSRKTLPALRAGAHDLVRNNPHAKRGLEAIVSNTVGKGVIPQFKIDGKVDKELEQLAIRHLDTKACDADGRHDYYGIQALAFKALTEGGEVLIRKRVRRASDRLPVPVQFQVLEGEFLDHTKEGITQGGYIIQGVEFNQLGQRVAYWIFESHPGGATYSGLPISKRIPASDIIHAFRVDRPGQVRGIPWLAPVMLRMQDFADYEDAQGMRQKIAACYAAFVTLNTDQDTGLPFPANATAEETEGAASFEPGMIERLSPGESIEFADPPTVNEFADYSKVSLRAIAAGLGVSYEAFTMDLSGVSFTSGRMGWLEFQRNIDQWRAFTLIGQVCDPLCNWFLEAAEFVGVNTSAATVSHTPPRREMINPAQETSSNLTAIRSGQRTLSQIVQESGRDPEEHFQELASDKKRIDELDLVLDSDASKVSAAGLTQARAEGTTIAGVFDEEGDNE